MEVNRNNNFDLIRLIAALSVIISHSYVLFGYDHKDLLAQNTYSEILFSDFGVWTFFIISGFLIDKSLSRATSLYDYFWKRIIRIFPGLVIIIIIAVFIVGPIISSLPSSEYFGQYETFTYLINFTLIRVYYNLPGVFNNNPYPGIVNGSLWTLQYEFLLYFIVGFQFFIRNTNYRLLYALVCLFLFLCLLFTGVKYALPIVWISIDNIAFLGSLFFIGVLINKFSLEKQILKLNSFGVSILFLLSLFFLPKLIIAFISLPLFIFRIAYLNIGLSSFFKKYGDYSYGIYIYSFMIQQILVEVFKSNFLLFMVFSIILSIIIGCLSWYLIEKPALKFRNFKAIPKRMGLDKNVTVGL